MVSICFGDSPYRTYSIPTSAQSPDFLPTYAVVNALSKVLEDPSVLKVMWNANYDVNVFLNHGVRTVRYCCGMVMAWCLDENKPKGLKDRSVEVHRHLRKTKNVDFEDTDELAIYAEQDARATWDLYRAFTKGQIELSEVPKTMVLSGVRKKFFHEQEMPLVDVVVSMERRGIQLDVDGIRKTAKKMEKRLDDLEDRIYTEAGHDFNIGSGPQLAGVLFDELDLPVLRRTKKTSRPSVDKMTLSLLRNHHPIVDFVLEHSAVRKLYSTYVCPEKDGLPCGLLAHADMAGVIHPTMNTVGAVTGRFSGSQPNPQNIPKDADRDEWKIRSKFIARPGHSLIVADKSQIELRLLTVFCRDPLLMKVYQEGGDVHQTTADTCRVIRDKAKAVNFGAVYGLQARSLAANLTFYGTPTTEAEAQALLDSFFNKTYKKIDPWRKSWIKLHNERGFVPLITGRPRRIPDLFSRNRFKRSVAERELINNTIQGSAADLMKQAMLRCHFDRELRELECFMLIQVHDELVFEVPTANAEKAARRVRELMCQLPDGLILPIDIPIEVNVAIGPNWRETEKLAA